MKWIMCGLVVVLLGALGAGCGKRSTTAEGDVGADGEEVSAAERVFLDAARPFAEAIAARQYARAYEFLSSHARARVSQNQFLPEDDEAAFQRNEDHPWTDVTVAQFAEGMQKVASTYGQPKSLAELGVFSTDAAVLNRRSQEEFGQLDSLLAIGAMPDSIPAEIRRASVRGQIRTELSTGQLAAVAKEMGMSVADLQQTGGLEPYFNCKIVLVEESGTLKVGYFEFLPPSMLD